MQTSTTGRMSVRSWLRGCKGKQGPRILLEAAKFPEPGLIGNVKDQVLSPSAEDWPGATGHRMGSPPA